MQRPSAIVRSNPEPPTAIASPPPTGAATKASHPKCWRSRRRSEHFRPIGGQATVDARTENQSHTTGGLLADGDQKVHLVKELTSELQRAIRSLRGSPGFSLAALMIFALGIGANTAMFGIVNAVLLKPLPFPESDRVVAVLHVHLPRPFLG